MADPSPQDQFPTDRRTLLIAKTLPRIKTGLRNKFAGIIMLLVGSMSLVFFLFFFQEERNALSSALEKRGFSLANNLARNVESYLKRPAAPELEKLLKNLLSINDIVYVSIFDKNGELATVKMLREAGALPELSFQDRTGAEETWRERDWAGVGKVWDFLVPVRTVRQTLNEIPSAARLYRGLGDEEIRRLLSPNTITLEQTGMVRLGLSPASMLRELRTKSLIVLGFFVGFLLLGIALVWFLSRVIVEPIQSLARAMKLVAAQHNDFEEEEIPLHRRFRRVDDISLQVQTHDEIEQLADDFRAMVKKLEDSYERLDQIISDKIRIAQEKTQMAEEMQKLNQTLEGTVKERTREVVEKNLKLYELSEELQFQKEELVNMNEQLEKSSRMKSAFLANMSHELRTPLNSIIGFAEILKDKMFGDLNERQEKYLNHILTSGRHLLQLINNVLDLSKVEAGKMKLTVEAFSMNRVIDEVQTIIKTLAFKKNIEIQQKLCPEVIMFADISKIKQVLYNLLSNAIKFTPERGTVTISTQEVPAGTGFPAAPGTRAFVMAGKALLLEVADNGIGIRTEEQEKIFREFEQTEQTRILGYEGTGLGLALTRKLVELHDGHIWLKSQPQIGSAFFVIIPIKGSSNESCRGEDEDA